MQGISLAGFSLIGGQAASATSVNFRATNPATGAALEPSFFSATANDVEHAASLAEAAFPAFAATTGKKRATFLRAIAAELAAETEAIVSRANLETGLPVPRLQGELARTTGQLKLFADVLDEGSWLEARIDLAEPDRKPLPRADIRSILRPLGPVAVFGTSNFPLAFSVAGGDTASALAAGNPVIVKAHPAHPGTSELVGKLIQRAVEQSGFHPGAFSLLLDSGIKVGQALVQHPAVQAAAFTGSAMAGQALMRLCADRPNPIPCYAEMGSTNPLFILAGALSERGDTIAQGLQASFTLGSGQFCTKPGLVFLPRKGSERFVEALKTGVDAMAPHGMLTPGIAQKYSSAVQQRLGQREAEWIAGNQATAEGQNGSATGVPALFAVSLGEFATQPNLEEEIFGPTTLLIYYDSLTDLIKATEALHGHLTATVHANAADLDVAANLVDALSTKVGRILFNGFPTGVEVCHAMVHGGPFPATSDGRSTSVGTRAIFRFSRPLCYQDCPESLLPLELQNSNPLGVMRLVNGALSRDAVAATP